MVGNGNRSTRINNKLNERERKRANILSASQNSFKLVFFMDLVMKSIPHLCPHKPLLRLLRNVNFMPQNLCYDIM